MSPPSSPNLSGQSVLVTGGTGFIGRALCATLAQQGARVLAVGRRATSAVEHPGIRTVGLDLADLDATRALIHEHRPSTVFHLASVVDGRPDVELVLPTLRSNLLSTVHVLLACQSEGVGRVVLTGTTEEAVGVAPHSPYSAAKSAAALYAALFAQTYHLPLVTVRLFSVFGPGQGDQKFIPYCIQSLLRGQSPRLGDGDRVCDWIYVDDVVEGLIAAATHTGVLGQTVELGSGVGLTLRETARRMAALIGTAVEPQFGARAGWGAGPRVADDSARRWMDWQPRVSLDEALTRTVEHFRRRMESTNPPGDA